MAKFKYTGTTKEGEKVEQEVEASDKYAVYDVARTNGHVVSRVSEVGKLSINSFFNVEKVNAFLSRIKGDELVTLTRNLSSMIKAGLPLTRALSVIERQTKNPRLKQIMLSIRENINKGKQLNEEIGRAHV